MYNTIKVQYADGTKDTLPTEDIRNKGLARSLMLAVFYSDSEIVSAVFVQDVGKPLSIYREAL